MRKLGLLFVFGVCALSPLSARAQSIAAGAPAGAKVEGPGIALGDRLVLHLGVGAEFRYDSNVFYETDNQTQGIALRLTPTVALATRNSQRNLPTEGAPAAPSKVEFRFGAGLDYREWIYANTGIRPPRQFNVLGNLALVILPSGPVTFELFDNFVRSSQPTYQVTDHNLDRDVNEVGFRLRIKPGGGRLELQLGYAFGIDLWETKEERGYDLFYHRSTIRLLWKFLPKTSVYIQGENYVYQYRHPETTDVAGVATLVRPDGFPLRIIAGLNGLLTAKLTFDLYAGYANGFYQAGPSPNTGMAGLTLTWRPYALGTLGLGYRHDFLNTLLGVYADVDNVQASWTQQIWRFLAFVRVAYQNTRYKGITPLVPSNGTERNDNGVTVNARLDYYAYKSWLALSLGYDLNLVRVDRQVLLAGAPPGILGTDFDKHEVYLGLSVQY